MQTIRRLRFVIFGVVSGLLFGTIGVLLRSLFDPPLSNLAIIIIVGGFGIFGPAFGIWQFLIDLRLSRLLVQREQTTEKLGSAS